MKLTKDLSYILLFGCALLVAIVLFNHASLNLCIGEATTLQIPLAEVESDFGNGIHRAKTLNDPEYIEYKIQITKEALTRVSDQHLFLSVGYFTVQAFEVYINDTHIASIGDYMFGRSDVGKIIHIVPLHQHLLQDDNTITFKTRSILNTGIKGNVSILNEISAIDHRQWLRFEYWLISFVVLGTLLLSIVLIFISFSLIRVRDSVFGSSYIWLSIAVIFLSIHSMELIGDNYYSLDYSMAYKMSRIYVFLAAFSIIWATKFFETKAKRYFVAPNLLLAMIWVTFSTNDIHLYNKYAEYLMLILIGIIILSIIQLMNSQHTQKMKKFGVNVAATIILSIFIRQLPSLINPDVILERSLVGIVPLCMFWFLVTYSILKELTIIYNNEKKVAKALKNQQEHVYKNMGEGFFKVGPSGIVEDVLTQVCNSIFGKSIKGTHLTDLIGMREEEGFVTELLDDLFKGSIPAELCFELLPEELEVGSRFFRLTYEMEKENEKMSALIVVMSDITEAKRYEFTLSEERNKLKMVVSTMLNRDDIVELVNEFLDFTKDINEGIYKSEEIINKVHTFKGNFGMYNLLHIVPYLHTLEDRLINGETIDLNLGNKLRNIIYEDLEIVTDITGSSFFEDELYLSVNKNNLKKVYQTVRRYFYDKEASLILSIVDQLFYKSIGDVLMFYARESAKTASIKDKTVNVAVLSGDEVFVDVNYYRDIFRSLVHVFNNCIEHGIENEEERLMAGKTPFGEISCNIDDVGNFFEIRISDDGRGIDLGEVYYKAISKEIVTEEMAEKMSEEEMLNLIFEPNFSTKSYAETLSGRGVGMAAVKAEVEKIGGKIRVSSVMDFGTTVKILLPKNQAKFIKFFSLPIVLDLYVESCKIYLKSNSVLDLPLSVSGINKGVEIFDVTVIIPFSGPKSGAFYFSANKSLIQGLAKAIMSFDTLDDLTEDLYEEIKGEVMKETCNIIAGNAISLFDVDNKIADIGTPSIIEPDHEIFDFNMLTWSLKHEDSNFCLGIVIDYEGEVLDMEGLLDY
jgi:signal transduction histidine kinase/CheY-specific phosphatase CheX/DNA-binding ferritin-like protein (Dps family)